MAWTDERIDDLAARVDRGFDLLLVEIRGLRQDMRDEFRSLRGEMGSLRSDLGATERQIAQIGWTLAGTLAAALIALVVTVALG